MSHMDRTNKQKKYLGFGLGLRHQHYETILSTQPPIDWFEILTENYLVPGGKPLYYAEKIRSTYPLVMHGVSMSIGSCDPLDMQYLKAVKQLAERLEPEWISDHLCWTGLHGKNTHDLLPLPYTEATIEHLIERIQTIQDFLGQQILIENVSSYVSFKQSEMNEWDFLSEVANRADCYILLDINNIYVSAINHTFNPVTYLEHLPWDRVWQIHLAGHSNVGNYIIDTHDHAIIEAVWELYKKTLKKISVISTLIERDDNIPSLDVLVTELNYARKIAADLINDK